MPASIYADALKRGLREKRRCAAAGIYPFLPALEDFISEDKISSGVSLGVCQIPTEKIVGTRTHSRADSFARNFMPVLAENSEFATKWIRLCDAQLDEGIQTPIVAYEFLNRYYVQEGHKRVSVLKYYDAVNIPGEVIRILPERTGDEMIERYYELIEFSRTTGINFLEFSHQGSTKELIRFAGHVPGEAWTEEEQNELRGAYYRLKKAFQICCGEGTAVQGGDVLLAALQEIAASGEKNAWRHLMTMDLAEMKVLITGLRRELRELDNRLWRQIQATGSIQPGSPVQPDREPEQQTPSAKQETGNMPRRVPKMDADRTREKIRILAVSDVEAKSYYDYYSPGKLDHVDLILSAGDLNPRYLEFLVTMARCPVFYVHGNHDEIYDKTPPLGCTCIDDDLVVYRGIRILGLGGSYRYRDGKYMYTEEQMRRRLQQLRLRLKIRRHHGFDILLTHAPARHINDFDTLSHRGFACFSELVDRWQPKFFVHGHVQRDYGPNIPQRDRRGNTEIINAFEYCLFDYA